MISEVALVMEDNRVSEQTFFILFILNDPTESGVGPAEIGLDYQPGAGRVRNFRMLFPAFNKKIVFYFFLFADDIAEGIEGFLVYSTPSDRSVVYTTPNRLSTVYQSTTIFIEDDDCKHYCDMYCGFFLQDILLLYYYCYCCYYLTAVLLLLYIYITTSTATNSTYFSTITTDISIITNLLLLLHLKIIIVFLIFFTAALVGFERLLYSVNEFAGLQEVCVTVTDPAIDQPLSLFIVVAYNTVMGSAGNIYSSYYTMHEFVLFLRCIYTYASFLHD